MQMSASETNNGYPRPAAIHTPGNKLIKAGVRCSQLHTALPGSSKGKEMWKKQAPGPTLLLQNHTSRPLLPHLTKPSTANRAPESQLFGCFGTPPALTHPPPAPGACSRPTRPVLLGVPPLSHHHRHLSDDTPHILRCVGGTQSAPCMHRPVTTLRAQGHRITTPQVLGLASLQTSHLGRPPQCNVLLNQHTLRIPPHYRNTPVLPPPPPPPLLLEAQSYDNVPTPDSGASPCASASS
jgi:hypothetical protein